MSVIVQKFGGSCLNSDEAILNAAKIIKAAYNESKNVIAVVSAQGDTTDVLIKKALKISKKPSKRELDVIMSVGEQLSASLLTMAVQNEGLPCVSLLGWQAGINTSSQFGASRIKDINLTRIKSELDKKNVIIIAGFQGVDKQGNMTTLGRGGADTTAVAVAAAINAEKCQIYSKIDGIYTADPKIVPNAVKIKEIEYDCMQELSFLGVKVLNPRAVELARKYSVTLEVLSAFESVGGTIIKESTKVEKMLISGVTKKSNIAIITVSKGENTTGRSYDIFGLLAKNNINVGIILQSLRDDSTTDMVFTVQEDSADEACELLISSGKVSADNITCNKDVARVSVVGAGMESHPGVASAIFEALSEININVLMISSSELRFSVVVKKEEADNAVTAIHKRFINL